MNEARNIPHVLGGLPVDVEVVLVDGRSTDGTVEVARATRPDVVVVHQTRKGKGNALACGFAAATGDIIVMFDADGSADAGEIPAFVGTLLGGADFAKGTRFAVGGGSSDITHLRAYGNRGLNRLVNTMYRTAFTDLCYGYNAFWRSCLPVFNLNAGTTEDGPQPQQWGDGFEIETLINVRASRAKLVIREVASFERDRVHGVSNLNAFSDGVRVLRTIAVEWRQRHRHVGVGATAVPTVRGPAADAAAGRHDDALASAGARPHSL